MLAQEKVFLLYIIFIFSLIDWRKANKEKIHRIYNKYRKPNFPKEIQASKFDKSSATKLPYGNLECAPRCLTARPNCPWAVLVALAESHFLA